MILTKRQIHQQCNTPRLMHNWCRRHGSPNYRHDCLVLGLLTQPPPTLSFRPLTNQHEQVAELTTRAEDLRVEVARATQDRASLREDASTAANRASEARCDLASAEKETARLASEAKMLCATKRSLESELDGLRQELAALRRRGGSPTSRGGGTKRDGGGLLVEGKSLTGPLVGGGVGVGGRYSCEKGISTPSLSAAGRTARHGVMHTNRDEEQYDSLGGGIVYGGEVEGDAWKGDSRLRHRHGSEEGDHISVQGNGSGGGGDGGVCTKSGNLVEIVAEFQGRLRRQVQAALADGGVPSNDGRKRGRRAAAPQPSSSVSRITVGLVDGPGPLEKASGKTRGDIFIHGRAGRSCSDVLGELEKRIGSV